MNTGGFIAAQGNNILIRNNRIIRAGVTVSGSNCSITNNNMDYGNIQVFGNHNLIDSNNPSGIYLGDAWGNGASFNIINNNTCQTIQLYYSTNNVVLKNNASLYGIQLEWSNNNFLYMNRASANWSYAVRFWLSSNNTFELNSLTYIITSPELIELSGSNNNLFSLNTFVYNPNNNGSYVYDDFKDPNSHTYLSSYSTNIWNQNNLGNYWGNYLTKYPNAVEVDNSGVGNQPYIINGNNTDAYPLMPDYNFSTASIKLPDWTNLTLPATIQTPVLPSPTPSATAMPTTNPTVNPTQAPTSNPTSNPTTNPATNQTSLPTQNPTSAPTPTPTTPEFTALLIVPLLLSAFAIAALVRHRKTVYFKQ